MDKFIKEYKLVKKDDELLNYLINILGRNLGLFYNKSIYNASLNILIESKIFEIINIFISYYKMKTIEEIKSIIEEKSKIFIDYQATEEKNKHNSIQIENKRDIIGFKKTTKIFLEQNYYFISQKFLIDYIIKNFCIQYFNTYRKKLDNFIDDLLILDNNLGIKNLLIDCFSSKLEDFAKNIKIPFKKENINNNGIIEIDLPNKSQINDEQLLISNEGIDTNSFDFDAKDESDFEEKKKKNNNSNNHEGENWFPLTNCALKYLDNHIEVSLNNYLQKNEIQDNYFNKYSTDNIFELLKEFVKNDLISFFNSKKAAFVNELDKNCKKRKLACNSIPIDSILEKEKAISNYSNKIEIEIEKLKENKEYGKLNYFTVIVAGKSGVGKSTLINNILKLKGKKAAEVGTGEIQTKVHHLYDSEEVNFIRIIDTRGFEYDKAFGPKEILNNTKKIINNQYKGSKSNDNEYNNFVQCIWYCISNSGINPKDIEIIKGLLSGQKILPLIVVYTNAVNQELITKMENEIKNQFPNIPFISTLAEKVEGIIDSFGLDKLIKKTTEVCKNDVGGDVFKAMKDKISKEITKHFNERNKKIKQDVNKLIIENFIEQKNLFKEESFKNYIAELMKIIFVGYLKKTNDEKRELKSESINNLKNADSILKPIDDYIQFYKKNATNYIDPILSEKAIYYLDEQAKKEKYEFKENMNVENKNNKKKFIDIINEFLSRNFYFIAQKCIIYHFITDVREPLSDNVEKEFNKIVEDFLSTDRANDLSKEFYRRKMDDLIQNINVYLEDGGYEEKNNNYRNNEYPRNSTLQKGTNNEYPRNSILPKGTNNEYPRNSILQKGTNNEYPRNSIYQKGTNNEYQKHSILEKGTNNYNQIENLDAPKGPFPSYFN